jgi:predicted lipid-binding transport protein (Tim44 family)
VPLNTLSSDRGSVAPLGIALLLGLIAMILGLAAAGHAALTGNRVQTLADAAILYAHDRLAASDSSASNPASTDPSASNPSASNPSASNPSTQLDQHLRRYFELAGPLTGYQLNYSAEATPEASRIRLCVMWQNPLTPVAPRELCRTAVAKSFEVSY